MTLKLRHAQGKYASKGTPSRPDIRSGCSMTSIFENSCSLFVSSLLRSWSTIINFVSVAGIGRLLIYSAAPFLWSLPSRPFILPTFANYAFLPHHLHHPHQCHLHICARCSYLLDRQTFPAFTHAHLRTPLATNLMRITNPTTSLTATAREGASASTARFVVYSNELYMSSLTQIWQDHGFGDLWSGRWRLPLTGRLLNEHSSRCSSLIAPLECHSPIRRQRVEG